METIMSTMVEISVAKIMMILAINTVMLIMRRIKLLMIINYAMIIYNGYLLDLSFFNQSIEPVLNTPALWLTVFTTANIMVATLCLYHYQK